MNVHIKEMIEYAPNYNHSFFAKQPVVYHCHHFNLFLEQTIDDALGTAEGIKLRVKAAHEATYNLLENVFRMSDVALPLERLQLASSIFRMMGQGSLHFSANQDGGIVKGEFLHYGFAWKEKYGKKVKKTSPTDSFAAGFAAAAVEASYDLPMGAISAEETQCISTGAPHCEFTLTRVNTPLRRRSTKPFQAKQPTFSGQHEEEITALTNQLVEFLDTLSTDERGLLQGFGVFVTMHLTEYYNRISYDAFYNILKKMPQSEGVMSDLFKESGHVCVFNTFGGILASPEWEGLYGSLKGYPAEIITGCNAIGRALGFGHWTVQEFVPNQTLVLRSPGTYESNYHTQHYETANNSRCFFFQGASLAMMQLAHQVDWSSRPNFDQDTYNKLFRSDVQWVVEETKCVSKGDAYCETFVRRK
ncbi:MAG: hypothetical protein CL920_30485 [Deltaproteobacteria bacterium]|nr:hypothetical protein [Deltaproteobacteria bacterium]